MVDKYKLTLSALKTLLTEIEQTEYVPVVDECIEKWETEKDLDMIRREFEKNGRFADFSISSKTARTPEIGFWSAQV